MESGQNSNRKSLFLNDKNPISGTESDSKKRMLINPTTGELEPLENYLVNNEKPFNNIEDVLGRANASEVYKESDMGNRVVIDNSDSQEDISDDSSMVSSSMLLGTRSTPKIQINYKKEKYGLFSNVPVSFDSEATLQNLSIKPEISFEPMSAIFKLIRESLQLYSPTTELANSELTITAVELDLELQEDNMYNKNITIQDIFSIFRSLSCNTPENKNDKTEFGEENLILNFNVCSKKRFLNRYNELVELVDNNGNLNHVFKFSNNSGNPLVLDEDEESNYESIDRRIINKSNITDDSDIEIIE
ncbi:hypothetical protein QEN19_001167 [Hanseniaspora menglaensis]